MRIFDGTLIYYDITISLGSFNSDNFYGVLSRSSLLITSLKYLGFSSYFCRNNESEPTFSEDISNNYNLKFKLSKAKLSKMHFKDVIPLPSSLTFHKSNTGLIRLRHLLEYERTCKLFTDVKV